MNVMKILIRNTLARTEFNGPRVIRLKGGGNPFQIPFP